MSATMTENSDYIKHSRLVYLPRRDPPRALRRETLLPKYKIIDREPGEDGIPRYIIRRQDNRQSTSRWLRVTIFDIEDFVTRQEVELFENEWFAHGNPDFTSFKQLRKAIKTAKMTGEYVFKRSPHIQVIVRQRPATDVPLMDMPSPAARRFSAANPNDGERDLSIQDSELDPDGQNNERSAAEEYEVARIVNHKDVLGNLYFHVVWAGFEDDDATWLTAEELNDAAWAIDEYFEAYEARMVQNVDDVNVPEERSARRTVIPDSDSQSGSLEDELT